MTNTFTTDVLICGAGAAGLALAVDLARRGVACRLTERADRPFGGSRGKGIQPRTLEIFEDFGIVDRLNAAGGPYPLQRLYQADGSVTDESPIADAPATPAEPYRAPRMVMQARTEAVLRERLVEFGSRPDYGCALEGFTQDADGVTATTTGGDGRRIVRARYLVGADGGRSFVRHQLGIDFPGRALGVRAIVADLTLSGLDRSIWHRFNAQDAGAQLALCPLAGTELFQLQAPIPAEGEPDLSVAGLQAFIDARAPGRGIVVQAVAWASAYGMNARLADRYRTGRVFLVGDAAHIHPPTGGQGLNTSVQDSYNLGWKLAAVLDGAPEALLETYEAERRPVAAAMLGLSTGLLDAAQRGDLRRGRREQQLDLRYPESSLAREAPGRTDGLRAGDRAPDAPLMGAGGQPMRLFTLLTGPHWTLIGYEADQAHAPAPRRGLRRHAIGPRGDLIDSEGHFRAAYGLDRGDWVLIRPDGYVGAIVSSARIDGLEAYLEAVGLGGRN